jgi:hypothetical protein
MLEHPEMQCWLHCCKRGASFSQDTVDPSLAVEILTLISVLDGMGWWKDDSVSRVAHAVERVKAFMSV